MESSSSSTDGIAPLPPKQSWLLLSASPLSLEALLQNGIAEIKMHQHYQNTYSYPLSSSSQLILTSPSQASRFSTMTDLLKQESKRDRKLNPRKPRHQERQTAAIASYMRTDWSVIRLRLGNFPPNSRARLTVELFGQLLVEDLSWCLRFPAIFIPRYTGNNPRFLATGASQLGNNSYGIVEEEK